MSISLTRVFLPLVLVLAFLVRWEPARTLHLAADERDLGASRWLIDDPDTCQHMRRIELAIAGDKVVAFDRFVNHPDGGEIPALPMFDTLVAGVAQRILQKPTGEEALGHVDEADLEDLVIKLSPILGLLLVLATWMAARNIVRGPRGDAAALLSALVVATYPACVASSSAGALDPMALACILFALLIRSVVRSVSAEALPGAVLDALMAGALAGLLTACTSLGFVLFLPAWVAFFVHALRSTGEARARALRAGLLFCLVAAFIGRMPLNEGPWEEREGIVRGFVSGVSMLLFLSTAPFVVLILLAREEKQRAFRTACFVAALLLMAWQLPQVWRDLGPAARWFTSNKSMITEIVPKLGLPSISILSVILLCLSLVAGTWAWSDRARPVTSSVLLFGLSSAGLAAIFPVAMPLAVVAVACLIARVFDLGLATDAERRGRTFARMTLASAGLLLAIAIPPFLRKPDAGQREERIAFVAGLRWMRTNTESGGPWNSARSSNAWGVMSMTGDGPLVQYHARRPALVSPWAVLSAPVELEYARGSWSRSLELFARYLKAGSARYVIVSGTQSRFAKDMQLAAKSPPPVKDAFLELMIASAYPSVRVGAFERVYASPRMVGSNGHVTLEAGTGWPVISILRLDSSAIEEVQPGMRPR